MNLTHSVAEIVDKPDNGIEIICENDQIKAVKINGVERKISSDESVEVFKKLREKYSTIECNFDCIFEDSREILKDLIAKDFAPCFSIPKEYIDEIIKKGALYPHETSFQRTVKLTAGTLGLTPYNVDRGRFIAILVNRNIGSINLQPRYTYRVKNTFLFQGVVATEQAIPLSDVIIIDPETMMLVYPSGSKVEVKNEDQEILAQELRSETSEMISQAIWEKERIFANYKPENLIDYFVKRFPYEYSSDLDLIDKENLAQHSLKVLKQFEKYFLSEKLPLGMDKNFFRLVLALHDVGKPRSLKEGNKDAHHEYSANIIKAVLEELGYRDNEIMLATNLVARDPIGSFFKTGNLSKSAQEVVSMAELANVDPIEFIELLSILYMCDASSYTEDAGSKRNLDYLFRIDKEKRRIDFSKEYSIKFGDLIDEVEVIMDARKAA